MIYTNLTKKALHLAYKHHKNDLDKGGIPYVYHLYHVASLMECEYSICVALLHDIIEFKHLKPIISVENIIRSIVILIFTF